MSIKCLKCGADNADNSLFCHQCGTSIAFRSPSASSASATPPPPASAANEPSPSPYASPRASTTMGQIPTADIFGGFWLRLVAAILDGIIINIVYWIVAVGIVGASTVTDNPMAAGFAGFGLIIFSVVGAWLYSALMESSSKQATLGKMALGLKVTDEAGERIGFGKATGRHFGKIISSLIIGVGYLMAGWTRKRQGLHDMMAGTLVVRNSALTEQIASGVEAPPVSGGAIAGIVAAACLVFAIPVVGILAAIAIPQYQDYTVRAKIMQAAAVATPAQQAIERYYKDKGEVPPTLADTDYVAINSPHVSKVTLDAETGTIGVELSFAPVAGQSLQFVPENDESQGLIWICRSEDIKEKLLPMNCRS